MSYRQRIGFGFGASLVIHAGLAALLVWLVLHAPEPVNPPPERMPVVFQRLPPPSTPRRVADAISPTREPAGQTDMIAEHNSKAQDLSDVVGKRLAPFFELPDETDHAAQPTPPAPVNGSYEKNGSHEKSSPITPSAKRLLPVTPMAKTEPATKHTENEAVKKTKEQPAPKKKKELVKTTPDLGTKHEAENKKEEQVATALDNDSTPPSSTRGAPALPTPQLPVGISRGRVEGGVMNKGFMTFEAMQDEVAPYLKEIQKRVDRNWRSVLEMRYSGATPTKAVIECAISPDGHVRFAEIVDPGDSATFAPLCKEAIEKAGPFPPFPFKVPDMYRSKDLEIRWTFSFLLPQ